MGRRSTITIKMPQDRSGNAGDITKGIVSAVNDAIAHVGSIIATNTTAPPSEPGPRNYSMLCSRVKQKLDAPSSLLTDDDIKRIAVVVHGNPRRTMHRCILQMVQRARALHDAKLITFARNKLVLFDSNIIKI